MYVNGVGIISIATGFVMRLKSSILRFITERMNVSGLSVMTTLLRYVHRVTMRLPKEAIFFAICTGMEQ